MAKDTGNGQGQKYGPKNFSVSMDGDDIVIRVNTQEMSHNPDGTPCLAGTPNPKGVARKVNLVGTSAGFTGVGSCQVSLNVTS